MKRDLVSIHDLSDEAIFGLMDLADELRQDLRGQSHNLDGVLMGSLFLEPSTRTRLSFEAAMARLGGRVITSSDPATSSAAKGETLADTVRIVDSYVDLTVLRHPAAGAARWAARHAESPVINAGDGAHEHPTQTLCDLYALRCERGAIHEMTVVLYGDLRFGRTTHSLARALVRMGARVLAIAENHLTLPDFVVHDLRRRAGWGAQEVVIADMEEVFSRQDVRALLVAPKAELPVASGEETAKWDLRGKRVDAIYVTRLQSERGAGNGFSLPILDDRFLGSQPFAETVVLHPLPRVTEIAPEVDRNPRAAYFRQAALGVPIRMALLMWAAGVTELAGVDGKGTNSDHADQGVPCSGLRCQNPSCIATLELGVPQEVAQKEGDQPRCLFCEEEAVA